MFAGELTNTYQQSELHPQLYIAKKHLINQKRYFPYIESIKQQIDLDNLILHQQATTAFFKDHQQDVAVSLTPIKNTEGDTSGFLLSANALPLNTISSPYNQAWLQTGIFWLLWSILYYLWRQKRESEAFSLQVLDSQPGMLALTSHNKLKYANKALLNFLGYENFSEFKQHHECICELFVKEKNYLTKMMDDLTWAEYILVHPELEHKAKILSFKENTPKILRVEAEPFTHESEEFLISLVDITMADQKNSQLEHEAQHDPLTKVFNRKGFEILLADYTSNYQPKFSLIMWDIDYFKVINDSYGHDVGDLVLKELTQLISKHLRSTDRLIRWGGEEFVILLQNTFLEQAELIANGLKRHINQNNFTKVGKVTCSFGVCEYQLNDNQDTVIKRCDQALYFAKKHGRNRVITG